MVLRPSPARRARLGLSPPARQDKARSSIAALEVALGFKRRVEASRAHTATSNGAPFYLMFSPLDLIRDHKALITSIRAQLAEGVDALPLSRSTRSTAASVSARKAKTRTWAAYVRAAERSATPSVALW